MALLLALYLWAAGFQAFIMMSSGEPVVVVMGIALLVLPVLGAWALYRELLFGFRSGALTKILDAEGGWPTTELPQKANGRMDRTAADAAFPEFAAAVDENPESWRAWFRLGLAYDACGDRKRARGAIRKAIALSQAEKKLTTPRT